MLQRNPIEKDVDTLIFSIEDCSMSDRRLFDTRFPREKGSEISLLEKKPFDGIKPIGADLLACQASQMRIK